eukprot:TRINITY_DN8909_c0_g1_i1.p1 TRINITY_DN8909_c0_g1~~TRINITY_DN8909_c0_g1_i1.p1  ORF type:complete len:209 (-),score=9.00 TRINITY_DN8909_c0_g1_i1:33-659(-)
MQQNQSKQQEFRDKYVCKACRKCFLYFSSLKKHMKFSHTELYKRLKEEKNFSENLIKMKSQDSSNSKKEQSAESVSLHNQLPSLEKVMEKEPNTPDHSTENQRIHSIHEPDRFSQNIPVFSNNNICQITEPTGHQGLYAYLTIFLPRSGTPIALPTSSEVVYQSSPFPLQVFSIPELLKNGLLRANLQLPVIRDFTQQAPRPSHTYTF